MKKLAAFSFALLFLLVPMFGCTESVLPAASSLTEATSVPPATDEPEATERSFSSTRLWLRIKEEYHDHIFTCDDFPGLAIDTIINDHFSSGFSEEESLGCLNYSVIPNDRSDDGILSICEALKRFESVQDAVPEFFPDPFGGEEFVSYKLSIMIKPEYHDHLYTMDDFPEFENCALIMPLDWLDPDKDLDQMWYEMILPLHAFDAVLSTCERLNARDDVACAEPIYYAFYCTVPNDYSTSGTYEQWGLAKISMPSAWSIKTGSSSIKVGVIDSGINNAHDDLEYRVNATLSKSFSTSDGPLIDTDNHGTMVAGIIGAQGNNGIGITGVCWNIRLVSLKVPESGVVNGNHIASAINYAKNKELPILNISIGVPQSTLLQNAVNNYSGLIVCAAGYGYYASINLDSNPIVFPACCTNDNILVVGTSTQTDHLFGFTNYGHYTVDLFAPGDSIRSTTASGSYGTDSGNSFSAPFVTGVAALLKSLHSDASASAIKNAIMENVDPVSSLSNKCLSGGRINAYKALSFSGFHTPSSITSITNQYHCYYCSACHKTLTERHLFIQSGSTQTCSVCGYSISTQEAGDEMS